MVQAQSTAFHCIVQEVGVLAVAQFRRVLFNLTETVAGNYLTAVRRAVRVRISLRKVNCDLFPLHHLLLELY